MSEAPISVTLKVATADFNAAIARVSEAIGSALMPSLREVARALRAWYDSWPGMPYTAPSLWDAEQMAAAPRTVR